ncbi:hypothetical protein OQJ18_00855 [Fluoribacter dumoffii]|uniref:Uncharacterized protein n=1 Tax=Fluoribacter dumoffii TaxID=463 RepID=A0A377GCP7_9GAMM|nr:hypothetical protein [Fluoribacter dumoffii]KTC90601.1 hypothetical protein Ldum_1669 [Fluoribacter dumoffii NY 23]MCW8386280.1 hypothetical protein [Fluoribacter dumoffii]MCW8419333.1 hypothetical protein [Fluoribacter dumoffii]MCW8452792.1 hypothetical protein [Fluoribacter dumoffii]MCW8459958.1 hypothetical protein [Fluoribacter dumoffii]
MLRKVGLGLLWFAASLSTSAYAAESLLPKATLEYVLRSNVPEPVANFFMWPIEAECKIVSEDESNDILFEALAKKGKVNNVDLTAGQSLLIKVHPNEILKISADSGARVDITNFGPHTVRAICTA